MKSYPGHLDCRGKKYDLKWSSSLVGFLIDADIRLVRAEYLLKLAQSRLLCPRRQEAELEKFEDVQGSSRTALVTTEEMKSLQYFPGPVRGPFPATVDGYFKASNARSKQILIVSVSHCWESQQHADPWGFQLRQLADRLNAPVRAGFEIWVFMDWISLPQYARTPAQQHHFQHAMGSMFVLYSHKAVAWVERIADLTPEIDRQQPPSVIDIYCKDTGKFEARPFSELVLNNTPYFQRGWCVAEVQWASTKVHLSHFAPMSPATFQERVRQGEVGSSDALVLKFTHRSDSELVEQLQEEVFELQATGRKVLVAKDLPWLEVQVLCESLPCFEVLRVLCLVDSSVGEQGAVALAKVLHEMEHLLKVGIDSCALGDRGASAVAAALKQMHCLSHVSFRRNGIGDAGAAALGVALGESRNLEFVDLRDNQISDAAGNVFAEQLQSEIRLRSFSDLAGKDSFPDRNCFVSSTGSTAATMTRLQSQLPLLHLEDFR